MLESVYDLKIIKKILIKKQNRKVEIHQIIIPGIINYFEK